MSGSLSLEKRAAQYLDTSEEQIEVTFEANDSYYIENFPLNECVNTFSLPLSPPANYRNYNGMMFPEPTMVVNFYTDDECKEYEFSVQSGVSQFSGAFASAKYVGEFSGVKPGVYDDHEVSNTAPPDANALVDTTTTTAAGTNAPTSSNAATVPSSSVPSGTSSAGFFAGVGLIGLIVIAGIVALGVMGYRKYDRKTRRGGDGRAFMTLASGQDDYDDETGLTGENGPHSSALMQSRAGASFDDERYPAEYHDEEQASDDERVEMNAYPQNPAGPTQTQNPHSQ
ncbi:hypothetical protein BGZ80_002515 [Entomortierella chlamydospora]|uniref:Uncharacterized protein n=1 Tax=Entomortierella chlamydospora TaxID=101097 RepID=A0A9P6SX99_9FUNG|nr:hypothetical protein BGZ79_001841 [Entomortierella chlamydospora]KAG0009320.1 hypothetical protein BGZ80_002515 [Entomortierella chlamydospora]